MGIGVSCEGLRTIEQTPIGFGTAVYGAAGTVIGRGRVLR